jgi:hypothetical protein
MSDILASVDRGDFVALVLLELSSAFNTVDHGILLQRLKRPFCFDGQVLSWSSSYPSLNELSVFDVVQTVLK